MVSQGSHPSGVNHMGVLQYQSHLFDPEELLNFTELRGFQSDWKELKLNIEDDLWCLQAELMLDPRHGDVIAGAGGLRKLRFSPPNWNRGKRSSLRVFYVYFEGFGHVLLIAACRKSDDAPLSEPGKRQIAALIEEENKILEERHFF